MVNIKPSKGINNISREVSIGNGNISTFKMNIKAILFSIQGFNQGWKKDWPHYNDFLFYTTEFHFLRWHNREFHRVLSIKVTKIQYLSCLETFETILQPLEQVSTKGSFDTFKSRKKKKTTTTNPPQLSIMLQNAETHFLRVKTMFSNTSTWMTTSCITLLNHEQKARNNRTLFLLKQPFIPSHCKFPNTTCQCCSPIHHLHPWLSPAWRPHEQLGESHPAALNSPAWCGSYLWKRMQKPRVRKGCLWGAKISIHKIIVTSLKS